MSAVYVQIKLLSFLLLFCGHSPATLTGRSPGGDCFVAKAGLGDGVACSMLQQVGCRAHLVIQPSSASI